MSRSDDEEWKKYMNRAFSPAYTPEEATRTDLRIAIALEYIAYQIGEIRRDVAHIRKYERDRR
jgi:hypothetical protein